MGLFKMSGGPGYTHSMHPVRSAFADQVRAYRAVYGDPNPDPKVFRVVMYWTIGRYTVAKIHYPGCTTFEGYKVLVYPTVVFDRLRQQKVLDPHFSSGPDSPLARFPATNDGLRSAIRFVQRVLVSD